MGYGRAASTRAWSTCSNSDFAEWYKNKGHRCLKSGTGGPPVIPSDGRSRLNLTPVFR